MYHLSLITGPQVVLCSQETQATQPKLKPLNPPTSESNFSGETTRNQVPAATPEPSSGAFLYLLCLSCYPTLRRFIYSLFVQSSANLPLSLLALALVTRMLN
jgi:hypothetical protein